MRGNLRAGSVEIIVWRLFKCACHALMQAAALQRTDLGVRHVPDLVVAEVKGNAPAVWLAHDASLPEFVQRIREGILAHVARLG